MSPLEVGLLMLFIAVVGTLWWWIDTEETDDINNLLKECPPMKYLIVIVTNGGALNTLAKDYDLERSKKLADSLQSHVVDQVKVLEETPKGYRVAYIAKPH